MDNVKSDIDLPELVNSAFACEVFLKTILKWYDIKSPKSHKLKDLYASTPDSIQAFIKATVLKNYDDIWTDEWGVEHLESLSNAFQDFRYFYEYDFRKNGGLHIETGFLIALRDALRDCCCRVIFGIGWEEYKGLKPIGSEK
ncbi:MAG: hypothetical protein E7355_04080 [Clostridiales bacterium]|nr:hypothetical protein [Clostridiales bacterium]